MRSGTGLITRYSNAGIAVVATQAWDVAHYALNYLGSGIAQFATAPAPWLALFAVVVGCAMVVARGNDRMARPWIGLMLFGVLSAVLTALGRADEGASQAFVSRYVSFSSMFWLGWVGLLAVVLRGAAKKAILPFGISLVVVFALVNAVSMTKQAERQAGEARALAAAVCASWPRIDRSLLQSMHYDGADVALERLRVVHALGFAPFDRCAPGTGESR